MSYYSLISLMPKAPAFDVDAQAFITAAAITDPTQQGAINTLVVDLKGFGIWTKMKAIYPIVGGTAASHKYNLKDPRDLDAAFRLTFASGWTHSANGMTPLNTFANTFLTPSTSLTLNNGSLSFYSRTNSNNLGVEIGARIAAPASDVSLGIFGTTPLVGRINTFANSAQLTVTDTFGFYQITRTGGLTQKVFKNTASNLGTITTSTAALTQRIYLGALNNNGANAFPSNRQCAFASIGDGLTDTEAANFYTTVQAYQTTLSRQV